MVVVLFEIICFINSKPLIIINLTAKVLNISVYTDIPMVKTKNLIVLSNKD